jgi:hypothetical protein
VHQDQTVSQMAQEALMRQVRALTQRSGHGRERACGEQSRGKGAPISCQQSKCAPVCG